MLEQYDCHVWDYYMNRMIALQPKRKRRARKAVSVAALLPNPFIQ